MIEGIEIERLRGIREGKLEGLTPLTILVGPSGSGKSTILDALLIATSKSPGDAVGRVVKRRAELPAGAPWLFERGANEASIKLNRADGITHSCILHLALDGMDQPYVEVKSGNLGANTTFLNAENDYRHGVHATAAPTAPFYIRLVEPSAGANHSSLVRAYEEAFQQGRVPAVRRMLPDILEGAVDLRVATYQDGNRDVPILHIEFVDYSIPVAAAGSGVYAVVRLALETASPPQALVLVEEPESHQHPAVIAQSAKVLLEAARRDVQLVVSTHSLELIDALVAEATGADFERLSVFRLALDKGLLRSSRFPGTMVVTARNSMGEDLR